MIGLMLVMLMVFHTCGELVLWGVGPILRNEYGIQGQNYVAMFQGAVFCRIASWKSKCKQIITAGIWYLVFDLKAPLVIVGTFLA